MTDDKPIRVHYEDLDIREDYRNYYKGKLFTGIAYEEYDDGQLEGEDTFVKGVLNGPRRSYYPNGRLESIEQLRDGAGDGLCQYWYENGQLKAEKLYDYGKLIKQRVWNEDGELIQDDWT